MNAETLHVLYHAINNVIVSASHAFSRLLQHSHMVGSFLFSVKKKNNIFVEETAISEPYV
ncbi:hypothetical protein C0J52_20122 [Blattella germanica]|nr:hypothetical protein C0J52_20122 [Blattella germanica]